MGSDLLVRVREIIGDKTPLLTDCGALCDGACCQCDEDGQGGVYLFPGEEALLQRISWGRIEPTDFAPMLVCEGQCTRNERPLGCRIFPLTPVRDRHGAWSVRMDARARAMCPLTRGGLSSLDPTFVRAVRDALRAAAKDAQTDVFLDRWQALEEAFRVPLWKNL